MTREPDIRRGVSFYSYQEEIFHGLMSVEDCIETTAHIGATGIEIIPEQSIPTYPEIGEDFYRDWHGWMVQYGTTPVCSDLFVDTKKYPGRLLTNEEAAAGMRRDITIGARLGVSVIRVLAITPPAAVELALPFAEEAGIKLALEIHSPLRYDHRWVQEHLELIHRVDSRYYGLMADAGTFTARFPRIEAEAALRHGATPRLVDFIVKTFDDHPSDMETLAVDVGWRGGNGVDIGLATSAMRHNFIDPRSMLPHMDYLFHMQAKFWEMVDEDHEWSIPYDEIVPVLIEGGFRGYLSSEYEGAGHLQGGPDPIDSVEQVRRQHVMLRRLLGEYDYTGKAAIA